ncbi:MAG: hypothetical protein K2M91_11945, partial [Lachnospiraceae bacterium]|nr:hypothetical protein [Lachnospiraceae bacterium]
SLPYEVETKVHDVFGLKTREKIDRLLALFRDKNQCEETSEKLLCDNRVILVFGDKNRMQLRQHFSTGVMLNKEMDEKAYKEHRYLSMQMEKLIKYARKDLDLQWKGWIELENFYHAIPVCMGAGGSCYAYGVPYGKGSKAKDLAALLGKLIHFDDLSQIIEYDIQNRNKWN